MIAIKKTAHPKSDLPQRELNELSFSTALLWIRSNNSIGIVRVYK